LFVVLGLPLQAMQDGGILTQIYMVVSIFGFLIFPALIFLGPRLIIWRTDRKLQEVLGDFDEYRSKSKDRFLEKLDAEEDQQFNEKFTSLRDFKLSQPTGIDPAGLVGKLESVLDASDDKFERFIRNNAETENEEDIADLEMAFRGVMGTHQVFKLMRHFRLLIKRTQAIQLAQLIQFQLPVLREIAEAQKEATRAFADQAPIGDAIGPFVAAKLISNENPEEVAEDIVHSEERIMDTEVHVVKSSGPGARLGKYGNAIEELADEHDIETILTVDAGAKLEGEETGSISEGVGVMMGGPGVEKTKIEEAAQEHGIPLEGLIIKQSPAEASKPMKEEIYSSWEKAVDRVQRNLRELEGPVVIIGVGNTCGVGNTREDVSDVSSRLQKYWSEYEEEEDEDVSYVGMMATLGGGGEQADALTSAKNQYLMQLPRL